VDIFSQELAALLKSPNPPHLLDVREPEEHDLAALPNAKLIPLGQLAGRVHELLALKEQDMVVYCHHGIRSLHAIHLLRPFGFTRLSNLAGGIDAWSREVDPSVPRY
jgi:rhodanese-related sulfurtransferase